MTLWATRPCFSSKNGVHTLGESQGLGGVHTQVNSMPVVFMSTGWGGMYDAGILWPASWLRDFSFTFHCPLEQSLNLLFKFVFYTCAFWLPLFRNSLSLATLCVLSLPHIGTFLSFVSSSVGSQHMPRPSPDRDAWSQNLCLPPKFS